MSATAEELFGAGLSDVGQRPVVVAKPSKKAEPQAQPQPSAYTGPIEFTIFGEPASKANSRELATVGPKDKRRTIFRKSDVALAYEEAALRQIPPKYRLQLKEPVAVTLRIFYASERPDLDESIVLDVMQNRTKLVEVPGTDQKKRVLLQAGVYVNDRQVREKHVYHGIDKLMPRTEVRIVSLALQGALL